jgi:hypothetical protein
LEHELQISYSTVTVTTSAVEPAEEIVIRLAELVAAVRVEPQPAGSVFALDAIVVLGTIAGVEAVLRVAALYTAAPLAEPRARSSAFISPEAVTENAVASASSLGIPVHV